MTAKLDAFFAWALLVLAALQGGSAFLHFEAMVAEEAAGAHREPALWWLSGGLILGFAAVLNLLRLRIGPRAPALLRLCLAADVLLFTMILGLFALHSEFLWPLRLPMLAVSGVEAACAWSAVRRLPPLPAGTGVWKPPAGTLGKLDFLCAATILLIEIGHVLFVFRYYQPLVHPAAIGAAKEPAFWWVAGGVAYWFGGGLNLVRIRHGAGVPALVRACLAVNVFMLAYVSGLLLVNPWFILWARGPLALCLIAEIGFSVRELIRRDDVVLAPGPAT